jgi:hypothetical protein
MNVFVARTALVPSSASHASHDGYCGLQVADEYRGAHADGFDYADYQADKLEWAKMAWDVAGTSLEGYLFLAAARDYADHKSYCESEGTEPLPRGKWCEAHVAGQIDRALEIADSV